MASGATLDLGGFNQAIGSLAGAGVVTNSGGSLAVLTEGGNNASTEFSGVIKDDGPTGLTKIGAGTLTLSGMNAYTGPTSVSAGVLQGGVANPFAVDATVAPGDPRSRRIQSGDRLARRRGRRDQQRREPRCANRGRKQRLDPVQWRHKGRRADRADQDRRRDC